MGQTDLRNNVSQRTPCVLVLDHSSSMDTVTNTGRSRIDELNAGLRAFASELHKDEVAESRVQIAIVSVCGDQAELMLDWTDADEFEPFELRTSGSTPLGQGIIIALDCIEEQKQLLREHGIGYTRPWIFILTDGEPTDSSGMWKQACAAARQAEAAGRVIIFPVGVADANLSKLSEISANKPKALESTHFRELFVWLSASLSTITRSKPGDEVSLPSVDGWAKIKL